MKMQKNKSKFKPSIRRGDAEMSKMRVTMHCGKRGHINHNKHNESVKNAAWDKTKTKDNFIWTCIDDCKDPARAELEVYEVLYGDALKMQNEKYIKNGQYKRVRDMETWKEAKQYRPCETILQIGDKNKNVSDDLLWECAVEFVNWKVKRFPNNYQVISMSDHVDETTRHIHIDETWFYHDEQGNRHPGIKQAMREMNVELPFPDEPEGATNYRKAIVDAECRVKWQQICIDHGLDIETEPDMARKEKEIGHMGVKQYKAYIEALESEQKEFDQLKENYENEQNRALNDILQQQQILKMQIEENEELIKLGKMKKAEIDKRNAKASAKFDNIQQKPTGYDFNY